jgi:potassium voltage-gated channel Shal-related subfamily D protein 2
MQTLYDLLEDPTSSSAAFIIHVFTTFLIITSAIITVLETLPPFHRTPGRVWFGLETALVVCFTVEYVCRAYAHSRTLAQFWNWFGSFFSIVDLLAVVPYYIEIAVQADTVSVSSLST